MCCGQKRSTLRNTLDPASPAPPATVPRLARTVQNNTARYEPNSLRPLSIPAPSRRPAQAPHAAVSLRYLENAPIRVQGHVTGRLYDFSGIHPIRTMDARDAPALLRTRLFRQA